MEGKDGDSFVQGVELGDKFKLHQEGGIYIHYLHVVPYQQVEGFQGHPMGSTMREPPQVQDPDSVCMQLGRMKNILLKSLMMTENDLHPDEVQVGSKPPAKVADVSPEPSLLDDRDAPHPEELDAFEDEGGSHQEASEQGAKKSAIAVPRQPSGEEERGHEVSHLPYRSWCQDCVRGKGLAQGHRRQGLEEDEKDQWGRLQELFPRMACEDATKGLDLPAQIEVNLPPQRGEDSDEGNAEKARAKKYQPRGIYIRQHMELEEYGYTDGCDGCDAAKMALSHRQHSVCKQRLREEMMETEAGKRKVEAVDNRAEEFIVKYKEAEDRRAQQTKRKLEDEPREDGDWLLGCLQRAWLARVSRCFA
eukprot:s20_g11.t1